MHFDNTFSLSDQCLAVERHKKFRWELDNMSYNVSVNV